ncbi:toxin-antitoxin system HicB family antitoxin [Lichenibacterium minor]|nr:toxin-antitoxin system HicB family antitoxin [Lichenibacterium minor]
MAKRIIDGKTYNTHTATRVWSFTFSDEDPDKFDVLYQNMHGVYFRNFGGLDSFNLWRDDIVPMTPEEAKSWLIENADAETVERFFGPQPEAGERFTQISLRIPDSLKRRITDIAKQQKLSLNSWIMRRLESAASTSTVDSGHNNNSRH